MLWVWEVPCPPEYRQGLHAEQGRILPVVLWPWSQHGGLPRDAGISRAFSVGRSARGEGSVEQRQEEGVQCWELSLADQRCDQAECWRCPLARRRSPPSSETCSQEICYSRRVWGIAVKSRQGLSSPDGWCVCPSPPRLLPDGDQLLLRREAGGPHHYLVQRGLPDLTQPALQPRREAVRPRCPGARAVPLGRRHPE